MFDRDVSFTDATINVCGVECVQFTLYRHLLLRLAHSPYIIDLPGNCEQAFQFLWIVSPRYSAKGGKEKAALRNYCVRKFYPPRPPIIHTRWLMNRWRDRSAKCAASLLELSDAILKYLKRARADQGGGKESGGSGKAFFNDCAAVCHDLGRAYGWPPRTAMHMPTAALFQLLKLIRADRMAESGKEPIMFNGSDHLWQRAILEGMEDE